MIKKLPDGSFIDYGEVPGDIPGPHSLLRYEGKDFSDTYDWDEPGIDWEAEADYRRHISFSSDRFDFWMFVLVCAGVAAVALAVMNLFLGGKL